jgi:hypothetical protein
MKKTYWHPYYTVNFPKVLLDRQRKEYSNLIAIVGEFRLGKTTLAIKLVKALMRLQNKELNISKQITILPEKFERLIKQNEPYSALIFDDANLFFGSGDYWDKYNKSLKRAIALTTDKYQTLIFTLPNLKRLYPDIKDVLNFLLKVRDKGYAEVYRIKDGKANYWFFQKFNPLPKDKYQEFLATRTEDLKKAERRKSTLELLKERAKRLYAEGKTQQQIAKKLQKSQATISLWLRT